MKNPRPIIHALAFAVVVLLTLNSQVATVSAQSLTITNPAPGSGDNFGVAVAAVGTDRVLIGACLDGGSDIGTAYLFSTNGTLLSTITNPTPAASDLFGFAVAAVGTDKLLIGAYLDDTGAGNAGAAYIFSTNGTLLITITNPTPAISDQFGYALAAVGTDKVLIGAFSDDTGAANAGAAYIFSTNGTLLTTITNPTPASTDLFGHAVAAVGADKVLIGADLDDTGAANAGAAYIFSTNGTLLTTITNPTPASSDQFGIAVAALGTDRVIIGANLDDTGSANAGAAYIFSTNGTLLTTITNPTPGSLGSDQFGFAVAAVGTDKVLIGALADDAGAIDAGAAYLFSTNGTLLTTFLKPTPASADFFGAAVTGVGTNRVLIGVYQDDTGATDTGAAYLFGLNIPPYIAAPPQSQTVILGNNATFTVDAGGSVPLSYQWQFNATNIAAATNASYTRTNAQFADAGGYTVVVTNLSGSVTSAAAILTVTPFSDASFLAGLPAAEYGSVAWGDYDNDGRLDILLTGTTDGSPSGAISQIWRNTGIGFPSFTNIFAGLPGVEFGSGAWGDYDNDGRLDILLTGYDTFGLAISQVWRNTGSGFTQVINAGLPEFDNGSAEWGDYDNDGRLDILLTGSAQGSGQPIAQVWHNTGSGGFADINAGLPGVTFSSAAGGDYDNDGRRDILLTGYATNAIAQVWRNTGNGFTDINAGLTGVTDGSVAWGDYDNDGRLDILLTGLMPGLINSTAISQVWRNTGNGFSNINAGLTGVYNSSAAWGDYDNDGRLDILLTGTTNGSSPAAISQVWRNTGNGFTNINAGLTNVYQGSATWGDYDNDGRLDILQTGADTNDLPVTKIWRNVHTFTNTLPTAPTGLTTLISGSNLILNWNAAADGQTPVAGLTYNIRVGSGPGSGNMVGPMAASSGYRRLPQLGNAGTSLAAIIPIVFGQTNYCSVQAVDGAFAGSPFSSEAVVKVLQWQAPPIIVPLPVSSLPVGDYNGNGVLDETEMNAVLTNYFANSPWLFMTNVAGLGGTNVTFALSNSAAGAFSVEYTTNLVDWQLLGPATPRYLFTDTNAPAVPQRYYRLRWP